MMRRITNQRSPHQPIAALARLAIALSLVAVAACARSHETRARDDDRGKVSPSPEPSATTPGVSSVPQRTGSNSAAPAASDVQRLAGPAVLDLVRGAGGRGSIVNIWATWCGPCRRELPMLRSLAVNLKAQGIGVILVSADEPEADAEVGRMLTDEGFSPPFYVAARPLGPFKQALHPEWPGVIPATFLFDATARRRYFWGGPVYEHELLPVVEGFVKGEPIDGEARFDLAPGMNTGP